MAYDSALGHGIDRWSTGTFEQKRKDECSCCRSRLEAEGFLVDSFIQKGHPSKSDESHQRRLTLVSTVAVPRNTGAEVCEQSVDAGRHSETVWVQAGGDWCPYMGRLIVVAA
jgi:hypothetical protein